jgi:hypothetical protein
MEYGNKVESIKTLIREAAWASKECCEILAQDTDDITDRANEFLAVPFLNKAISFMAAAQAVYICEYENLGNPQVENIFFRFSVFESEALNNFKTWHSHQWSDIEFNNFKEACGFLLGEL